MKNRYYMQKVPDMKALRVMELKGNLTIDDVALASSYPVEDITEYLDKGHIIFRELFCMVHGEWCIPVIEGLLTRKWDHEDQNYSWTYFHRLEDLMEEQK